MFGATVLASLVVLFVPGGGVPGGPAWADEVVHAVLFALLAVTGSAVLPARALVPGLAGYAVATEVAQGLLPLQRAAAAGDVLADLVGAAAGLLLVGAGRALLRPSAPGARRGRRTTR